MRIKQNLWEICHAFTTVSIFRDLNKKFVEIYHRELFNGICVKTVIKTKIMFMVYLKYDN